LDLIVLNYDNLYDYIDEAYISKKQLKTLTIMQQKDAVSYAVLYKHGGVFLDVDTIIFKDIFVEIEKLEEGKLYLFGNHCGALICKKPGNEALLQCMSAVKAMLKRENSLGAFFSIYKLKRLGKAMAKMFLGLFLTKYQGSSMRCLLAWDATANAIIDPVMQSPALAHSTGTLDLLQTGVIAERFFFDNKGRSDLDNRKQNYLDLYFNANDIQATDVIEKAAFGMVLLHHSWTPHGYRGLDCQAVKADASLMSGLLKQLL
jgi:hypothetical protein